MYVIDLLACMEWHDDLVELKFETVTNLCLGLTFYIQLL